MSPPAPRTSRPGSPRRSRQIRTRRAPPWRTGTGRTTPASVTVSWATSGPGRHRHDAWPRVRDRGRLRADPARPGGGDPVAGRRSDRVAGPGLGPAAAVGADQRIAQRQAEDQQQPDGPGDEDQPEPVVLPRLGDGIGVHPADVAVRARPGRRDAAGDGRRPERQRRRREHVDVGDAVGRVDQLVEERLRRVAGRPEVALEAVPRRHRGQPLVADVVERQVGRPLRAADDDRRHDRREEQHGDQQPDAHAGAADEPFGRRAERRDGREEPVEERHQQRHGLTRSRSRSVEVLGWRMGLEPITFGATIRCSAIELTPPRIAPLDRLWRSRELWAEGVYPETGTLPALDGRRIMGVRGRPGRPHHGSQR